MPSRHEAGTSLHRLLHIRVQRSNCIGIREWTKFCLVICRIADHQRLHARDKFSLKCICNRLGNDEALGRNTGLPVIDDSGLHRRLDRCIQVRAGHHDKRIAAAELKHNFLDSLGRAHTHLDARLLAARQRCGHNTWIIQQVIHSLRPDQQCLKRALRKAGAAEKLFDLERALRNVRSVL